MSSEETQGYGKFEYVNGSIYEGHWVLQDGVRIKEGQGELRLQNNEKFVGCFENDQMHGYGIYYYACGAVYSGEWENGKAQGKGLYEFQNGASYDGDWLNHRMHGEGCFLDADGQKYEGEFVEGVYQSKLQLQLKIERAQKKKQIQILQDVMNFFKNFDQKFKSTDAKQMKDRLITFFANYDETYILVKQNQYPKIEDKKHEDWHAFLMSFTQPETKVEVIKQNTDAKILDPSNILAPQFNGVGQVVEFQNDQKQLVLCQAGGKWVIIHYKE